MSQDPPSERARVRRLPERASYERDAIEAILREGLVAHLAVVDGGAPFALPMVYGFDGRALYLHGSPASRLMRALAAGTPACVTVTLLDGLVLPPSVRGWRRGPHA